MPGAATSTATRSCSWQIEGMLGTVVGGTRYADPHARAERFFFDQVDLDAGSVSRIPLDFLAHGFTQHPARPDLAATFEKKGPGGARLDLAAGRFVDALAASPGAAFYGHGTYSHDGRWLYVVEAALDSQRGLITVRDARSARIVGTLDTHGSSPHDCVLADQGKTLVVSNGGGPLGSDDFASVAFVELESGRLLERLPVSDVRLNAGHLALTARRDVGLVSAPRTGLDAERDLGGISVSRAGEPLVTLRDPPAVLARQIGETLSVCVHEPSRVLAATSPRGGVVTFWRLDDLGLVATLDVASPRGITVARDGSCFVLACGARAEIWTVCTEKYEVLPRRWGSALLSGSHAHLRREWKPA